MCTPLLLLLVLNSGHFRTHPSDVHPGTFTIFLLSFLSVPHVKGIALYMSQIRLFKSLFTNDPTDIISQEFREK